MYAELVFVLKLRPGKYSPRHSAESSRNRGWARHRGWGAETLRQGAAERDQHGGRERQTGSKRERGQETERGRQNIMFVCLFVYNTKYFGVRSMSYQVLLWYIERIEPLAIPPRSSVPPQLAFRGSGFRIPGSGFRVPGPGFRESLKVVSHET